ncbi:MAG: hypothetical protein VZR64_00270 [Eubacterium sp.]|nr:hypothetical protein [Eubacterium sp.]
MSTTVINIGVTDDAEALLNEELKKIEGYTSHVVTNNGFNSQLIVFGADSDGAATTEGDDAAEGDDEPTTTSTLQAKLLRVPLDQAEAEKAISEAINGLTLVTTNPITAIDSNRLLIMYEATEEESTTDEPADDDPKEP